jgi:AmiR/NasT family two-component response regulator
MNRSLKIAVAADELNMRDYFQKILPLPGHRVVAVAANGRELVEQCRVSRPDLVITRHQDARPIEIARAILTAEETFGSSN